MRDFWLERRFREYVRQPTRGEYLLDLVLSNLGSEIKIDVISEIADHRGVFGALQFPLPQPKTFSASAFQLFSCRLECHCKRTCDYRVE